MATPEYIKMAGEIFLAERDNLGKPIQPWQSIGDAQNCEIGLATEELNVRENMSGHSRIALSLTTSTDATLKITFRNFKAENLALMVLGIVIEVATATITNEVFPDDIENGQSFWLDKRAKLSAPLVIKDSTAGTPLTLAAEKFNHDGYGFVTFLDVSGYVQPFKVPTYSVNKSTRIPLLTTAPPIRAFRLAGRNTAKPVGGDFQRKEANLKKVQFKAAQALALIQDGGNDIGTADVEGTILEDEFTIASETVSPYGEIINLS